MNASVPPPLVGFNNNVRYRGMRFHIQTEDSGCARPHIITHLFADGGHVIKSLRTDYSEYVNRPDRPALIQQMMRDQHRAMALDLRDGRLDETIDGLRLSAPPPPSESAPPVARKTKAKAEPEQASTKGKAKAKASAPESPAKSENAEAKPARRSSSRPAPKRRKQSHPPSSKGPSTRRGRPSASAVLQAKPKGDSIFGALPQESLDEVILSYVTTKNGPPSRRSK